MPDLVYVGWINSVNPYVLYDLVSGKLPWYVDRCVKRTNVRPWQSSRCHQAIKRPSPMEYNVLLVFICFVDVCRTRFVTRGNDGLDNSGHKTSSLLDIATNRWGPSFQWLTPEDRSHTHVFVVYGAILQLHLHTLTTKVNEGNGFLTSITFVKCDRAMFEASISDYCPLTGVQLERPCVSRAMEDGVCFYAFMKN